MGSPRVVTPEVLEKLPGGVALRSDVSCREEPRRPDSWQNLQHVTYLSAIWELSERQLGYLGSQGALSHPGLIFCVFTERKKQTCFEMYILRCVFEGRYHQVL